MKKLLILIGVVSLAACSKGGQFVGTWQNVAESHVTLQITKNSGGEGFSIDEIESVPEHEVKDTILGGKYKVRAEYNKVSFTGKLDGEVLNVTLPYGMVTPAKVQGDTLIWNSGSSCDKCDTYRKVSD